MSCLVAEDLKSYKYRCQDIEICCNDEQIDEALQAAQEVIERYIGFKLCPEETCKFFDGNGTDLLFLTEITNQPLSETTEVKVHDYAKGTFEEIDIDTLFFEPYTVMRKGCKKWPCGRRNIEICGLYGKELPVGVKNVLIALALESLQPGSAGLQLAGATRTDWDDFSISYRVDETFNILRDTTGFRQLDNILENYVNAFSQAQLSVLPSCNNTSCCDNTGRCG